MHAEHVDKALRTEHGRVSLYEYDPSRLADYTVTLLATLLFGTFVVVVVVVVVVVETSPGRHPQETVT